MARMPSRRRHRDMSCYGVPSPKATYWVQEVRIRTKCSAVVLAYSFAKLLFNIGFACLTVHE